MVLEKRMKKKNFRTLVYLFGIIVEILGFGILFKSQFILDLISSRTFFIGLILIFGGYLMAVSVRPRIRKR